MPGNSTEDLIPKGLESPEHGVYEKLIGFVNERKKRGEGPRPIVVITHVGQDYDNLAALVVLTELHRLGLVDLRAVVANQIPTDKRPHLARAVIDSLGLRHIPVARSSRGSSEGFEELPPEFSEFSWPSHVPVLDGQDLLQVVYKKAKDNDEKLYLLCLSSLQDLQEFTSKHKVLVAECTAEDVYLCSDMDGAVVGGCDSLQPNPFKSIHTTTKGDAFAVRLMPDVFVDLGAMGHPVGAYLRRIQVERDVESYKRACDQEKRLFLANKTNWKEGDALPRDEEIIQYITNIVLHNVRAALSVATLGVAGENVILGEIQSRDRPVEEESNSQRQTVVISEAVPSLLKGSLLVAVCDFCNGIDFELVGFCLESDLTGQVQDIDKTHRRPIREVLQNSKRCMFCRKVTEYFRQWRLGKVNVQALNLQDERNWAHYEMVSLKSDKQHEPRGRLIRMQVTLNVWSRSIGACGLVLEFQKCSQRHPPKTMLAPLKVEEFCNKEGSKTDWGIGQEQAYSGRIRPLKAEILLFRKWIETCEDKHTHPYCGTSIKGDEAEKRLMFMFTGLDGLRLVDVVNMCVVDDKGNERYTALSYRWGSDDSDHWSKLGYLSKNRYLQRGSLQTENLPKTIVDAIEVTKQLEYDYIWIDRLCIMQDDDIDKRYFLPKMDVICGCAVFTIVAAAGDIDAGLPGIREGLRTCEQKPFTIKGVSLVRTLDPEGSKQRHSSFHGYLKDSEWCKRAWTFQEKLLSPRALIFTEEQVYWECQGATWCEDGIWETMKSSIVEYPTLYRHCFGDKDYCHPWEGSVERRYRKMVDEYSGRTLTDEEDRRDAFEGILQRFQWDAKRGQAFLWALPKRFLSNALTWCCEEICPERRQHKCPVKHEFDKKITYCPFPSWSWLGWEGKVCFSTSHGRLYARTVDLIFYYFSGSKLLSINQTGATQSLSDMDIRKEDKGHKTIVSPENIPKSVDRYLVLENDQSNILFFWSSTAKLYVQREMGDYPTLHKSDSPSPRDDDKVPASFWFQTPAFPPGQDEPRRLEFEFVVIGKFTEYRKEEDRNGLLSEMIVNTLDKGLLAVLLVSLEDGVAYRKGLVHIDPWDWKALNPEWKLIMLG